VVDDNRGTRPHGRDEVVAALLEVATRLFAERGPTAVSLREIASEADVNIGLIHRHIGSKADLLAAVLRSRPGAGPIDAATSESLETFIATLLGHDIGQSLLSRLQARTILDGYDLLELQGDFPLYEHGARELRTRLPDEVAEVRAALLATLVVGWQLFGPTALKIVGLAHLPTEQVMEALRPAIDSFLAAPSPARD
jgi:AcrR family transcriptional regulator